MTRSPFAKSSSKPEKQPAADCSKPAPAPPDCGCGCGGACNCGLECLTRPAYFCGQLLTDADLTLDQRYFRRKNRLYHQALHGHGIVCGLRLTCDPECEGRVRIEEGYAIDKCGNDLVICETRVFDVISQLRKKNLLIKPSKPAKEEHAGHPNAGGEATKACDVSQCFQIAIRYAEQASDYTTPLNAGACGAALGECEPTRILETVDVDVFDDLPVPSDPLEDLTKRLEHCFRVFREDPFGLALSSARETLRKLFATKQAPSTTETGEYETLFRKLFKLFELHLEKWPDLYDCSLKKALCEIHPHGEGGWGYGEALCKLLNLVRRSTIDCFFGELVPRCPVGECGGWVIVGTVEIVNGCLSRVCNCPRSYVWSFVNFPQVLLTTILASRACTGAIHYGRKEICCTEIEDEDCGLLLELLAANPSALGLAATEPLARIAELRDSARAVFDLTKPGLFSPRIVRDKPTKDAQEILSRLGVTTERQPHEAKAPRGPFPLEAFGLISRDDSVTLTGDEKVEEVSIYPGRAPRVGPGDRQTLDQARQDAASARELAGDAAEMIKKLQERVETLEKQLRPQTPGEPQYPSPPAGPNT